MLLVCLAICCAGKSQSGSNEGSFIEIPYSAPLTRGGAACRGALQVLIKQAVIKSQRQAMTPWFNVVCTSGTWLVFSRRADKASFFCTAALNSNVSRDEDAHVVCSVTSLLSAGASAQNTGMNCQASQASSFYWRSMRTTLGYDHL